MPSAQPAASEEAKPLLQWVYVYVCLLTPYITPGELAEVSTGKVRKVQDSGCGDAENRLWEGASLARYKQPD